MRASDRWIRNGWLLAGLMLAGCGSTPCEEAAQICADQGRSEGASNTGEASCEGATEAQAECITERESCAPDVVEACWKSVGGDEEDTQQAE